MRCTDCGNDNRDGANFCRECGSPLTEPAQPQALPERPPEDGGATPQGAVPQGVHEGAPSADTTAVEEPEAADMRDGAADPETAVELLAEDDDEPIVGDAPAEDGQGDPSPDTSQSLGEAAVAIEPADDTSLGAEGEVDDVGALGGAAPDPNEKRAGAEPVVEEGQAPGEAHDADLPVEAAPPLPEDGDKDLASPAATSEDAGSTGDQPGEALSPVPPGTLLADRYLIIEALDVEEDQILYRARDLQLCWQCGFAGNSNDDTFCAQCGASLDRKQDVQLLQVSSLVPEVAGAEGEAELFSEQGRTFLVLAAPDKEPEQAPQSLRLVVGQSTHEGQVRELNEDSLASMSLSPMYESQTSPLLGLFAVADGMGGHEGGEVASKLALRVFVGQLLRTVFASELQGNRLGEEELTARLADAATAANDAVYLARQKRGNDMGTTLTAALVRDDRLVLAHVGDCRAYRWGASGLEQLSTDHSLVATLVERGEATPDEVYTHPHRSVILRCVGDLPVVEVETSTWSLAPQERLVICSDGLWEMVRNAGIEDAMMQEADPQAACELLVRRANLAGGEDNITVIVAQVEVS